VYFEISVLFLFKGPVRPALIHTVVNGCGCHPPILTKVISRNVIHKLAK
jgi:hypothetical protein